MVETILTGDDRSTVSINSGVTIVDGEEAPNNGAEERGDQMLAGRIYNPTDEDDMSDVSLDAYFNDMEDYQFLFSDDEDAIDPNSAALANEIESREVYRQRYNNYVKRKKELIEENWTVQIDPPSENGIEIGDRVREHKRNPRYGIVVGKHPDSVPGTPLWNVLFDGDEEETLALSGRRDLRKIYDTRVFTWRIVDGDSTPNDPVEEYEHVGVVGFDFHKSFSSGNLSTANQRYDFPFLRLLIHLWPGKSLIVEFAKLCCHLNSQIEFSFCLCTGSWRDQLHRLNSAINERNEGRVRSRQLRAVTEHEWWAFWGIVIGAAPCHKGGIRLFDDDSTGAHRQFSPKVNASKGGMDVMSKTRFFDIKEVLPRAFEGNNHGQKWNQIKPLVDGFNNNRRRTVAASSTITLDEAMSAFQPRTTKTSTLPHLSYIKRKPKPLGTEFKVRNCFGAVPMWLLVQTVSSTS